MTKADKGAVNKYKAALRAHKVMYFDVTDKIVKALPLTVKATGSDPQDATTNLQAAADTHQLDAQTAIDTATTDYDTKTATARTGRGRRRQRPPHLPVFSLRASSGLARVAVRPSSSAEPCCQRGVALHERLLGLVVPGLAAGAAGEVRGVGREVVAGGGLVRVGRDVVGVLPVALLGVLDDRRERVRVAQGCGERAGPSEIR